MHCRLKRLDENEEDLKAHLKSYLLNYASVSRLTYKFRACYISDFADIL